MYNYVISLAYNGKNYHGWQIQPNANTIQAEIQKALSVILREQIRIVGAGRTDTGVHASFYVANFKFSKKIIDLEKLTKSLNGFLPNDISIYSISNIDNDFNSRFAAISRTYHYNISTIKTPFWSDFSLLHIYKLDVEKMKQACEILFEYKNFKSFEKLHSDNKTSNCQMYEAKWTETENMLIFKIKADRFLRNMVRSIVGTMLEIGRNKVTIEQFRNIIESRKRANAGASVLPNGLFLTDIQYPSEMNDLFQYARKKSKFFLH